MRRVVACSVAGLAAWVMATPVAPASAGGAAAPAESDAGGAEFGVSVKPKRAKRPVATIFQASPQRVRVGGDPPRLALRIDQRGVQRVSARIVFWPLHGRGSVLRLDLGRVPTGTVLRPRWPAGQALVAGSYVVRLHARGPGGGTLLRRVRSTGRARLTVLPKPAPPAPVAPVTPVAPTPTPVTPGGVFPVGGPHEYGREDARFGADRGSHSHEGQDITAAEGTPVLAPLDGTITVRDYQASGAGFYLVQAAVDGRHFFFAHCQKDTFAVAEGQAVGAGQQICRVGRTGRSSGPHLHFEIWTGGWRASKESRPVDPLAQLLAWDPDH